MKKYAILSQKKNMVWGFAPAVMAMLLSHCISQTWALYISTIFAAGLLAVCITIHRPIVPNYLWRYTTAIMALLSLSELLFPSSIPPQTLSITLEAALLIPLALFYLARKTLSAYLLKHTQSHKKEYAKQGIEYAIVSSRFALILGMLHFMVISIASIFYLTKTHPSVLHTLCVVIPPFIFIASIVFNSVAIHYFNQIMRHEKYVPIVNNKGIIIGRALEIDALCHKTSHLIPVVRVVIIVRGMILLTRKPSFAPWDKGRIDCPLEGCVYFNETPSEAAKRLTQLVIPNLEEEEKPQLGFTYHFENKYTNRFVYVYTIQLENESRLKKSPILEKSKLWNDSQIKANLHKGYFGQCFEAEFEDIGELIYT